MILAILFTITIASAPPADGQTFQLLHTFTDGGDGSTPNTGLTIGPKGKLYGGTVAGGGGNGLIYDVAHSGSGWILNVLNPLEFRGSAVNTNTMVFGPDGNLYGASSLGGIDNCGEGGGCGVVFKLQPPPSACVSFTCYWKETVLYSFTGGSDGGTPGSPVIFDKVGNLYGTTIFGGIGSCDANAGCGVVYELSPSGSGWTETVLHEFNASDDGVTPGGKLVMDAAGNLYGVAGGGNSNNDGIIWELTPNHGVWTETVLHTFQTGTGTFPCGGLSADSSGNIYGITDTDGGGESSGVAFELSPPGTWTYNVLSRFPGDSIPCGPPAVDTAGNIYATSDQGGQYGNGSLFKVTFSNGTWTTTDLHDFQASDGIDSEGGVSLDASGNIYGTSSGGGGFSNICYQGCGTVWEYMP